MSTTMQIQIPAGTAPNAILQVRAPDGRTIKVRVPPNVRPGQQMRIAVPAADVDRASEAGDRDARRRQREEAARYREAAAARDKAQSRSAAVKAAVKAAKVPANPSRGRLPVAGLVGKSFGLYQKDQKAWLALRLARSFAIKNGSWAGWDTARFVAFDAGKNRVAFRNPGTERWLRVTADGVTEAPARGNWNATWGWERFELHELAGGVGLRSASGRWLTIEGKRTIQLEPLGAWDADERAAAHEKKLSEEMERAAAADRAEAERRAAELRRFAAAAQAPAATPEEPEPETVATDTPAGEASRAEAVDEPPTTERIDCDSPRVDLGGASELSARIDALFRVRRSPALAAQLNKIYEHHESIPRYTT
ncbi:unnamed protein product [Pelagomonas calceolata]|uniref:Uncharacterized protein n=2 Tax=Pelagomonas calceolata TaxID=35677 RepID=A0A8J2X281_9STRA|nr:unnamed protein product [Pelagomonas calceolata]